jgi:hypothetical protein
VTTLPRKLAVKISGLVVRLASSDMKEWAQATLREIEFIECDWAALRWALGGTRILLGRKEIPVSSRADVPKVALRFAKEIRGRTVIGCIVCVVESVWIGGSAHLLRNPIQRTGCFLLVGATLYMVIQLVARRGSLPVKGEQPDSPDVYRAELKRQRDFHRGGWLWSRVLLLLPGFVLFCRGAAIAHPWMSHRFAVMAIAFCILCAIAIPNNLQLARRYQRRIDDLDVVEASEA